MTTFMLRRLNQSHKSERSNAWLQWVNIAARFVPSMKKLNSLMIALATVASLSVTATYAQNAPKADRDMPMNAEADALRYDDLKQTSVFTGNVVITKGTTIIRGERVDVRQDPQGYQFATVIAPAGKRAFYRKKREGVDEYIEGEGELIEYDSQADIVKFTRRAELRRYNGATLVDETSGALITYNNITDVFTVDGGTKNSTAANPSGRVRALLSPRAAAAAPKAAPTPSPNPMLRPSLRLNTDKN
jgi:lipopolysaccharide export system protein LptA